MVFVPRRPHKLLRAFPRRHAALLCHTSHVTRHTSHTGMPPSFVPEAYTTNALDRLDRGRGAWQAARAVFNIAQLKFSFAIQDIAAAQQAVEAAGARIQADVDSRYKDDRDLAWACQAFAAHAAQAVQLWWSLR